MATFLKSVTVAIVVTLFVAATVAAQGAASSKPAAGGAKTKGKWTVPRTPWGDPDLQGLWPSIDMQGTPYERPPELAGKAVLDDEEFAARAKTQDARRRGWGEQGIASRQASLIVEPADGRFPPLTPEGQRRFETAKSTYYLDFPDAVVHHPFDNFEDLGPYDRCITRGVLASMMPTAYNMGNEIFQIPGYVKGNYAMTNILSGARSDDRAAGAADTQR